MEANNHFYRLMEQAAGKELADKMEYNRVEIDAESGDWTVFLTEHTPVCDGDKELIEHALAAALPDGIRVHFVYTPELDEQEAPDLLDILADRSPFLHKVVNCWDISFNGKLVVNLNGMSLSTPPATRAAELLEELALEFYGEGTVVLFLGEGEAQEANQTLEEEFNRCLVESEAAHANIHNKNALQKSVPAERKPVSQRRLKSEITVLHGRRINDALAVTNIGELKGDGGVYIINGEVLRSEKRELESGKDLYQITLTDFTSSITAKIFLEREKDPLVFKPQMYLAVRGRCVEDTYMKCLSLMAMDVNLLARKLPTDEATEKRVELHLHTNLSALDSVVKVDELVGLAKQYGHDTLTVTDHGVVQAYPDMYNACNKAGIKCVYGMEAYLLNDTGSALVGKCSDVPLASSVYVVFDVETTGLNVSRDSLTEISAVKISSGVLGDRFSTLVNPGRPIPQRITELTGITDEMVANAPTPGEAVKRFQEFCGDALLVAHNASFDMGFMREEARRSGQSFEYTAIDTLTIARHLYPEFKNHRLNTLAKKLGIVLEQHHRAESDAATTANIFLRLLGQLQSKGATNLSDIDAVLASCGTTAGSIYHAVLLVKNATGLFNLYRLVTASHIEHFRSRPLLPKSLLMQNREGLILGSACEQGELYRALLGGANETELEELAKQYDYLEVQPLGNNAFMLREGMVSGLDDLKAYNEQIIALGDRLNIPVVATGDVHFLRDRDEYFRRIIQHCNGFDDADLQAPLYYRTTEEMLREFEYLTPEKAQEIVVNNPRMLTDQCEMLPPFPMDKLYTPEIPGAEEEIARMVDARALMLYGETLPDVVSKRIKKELDAIISSGFAVLYLIAHKVVKKSISDRYIVGSRGSVGSSFVAMLMEITEVNPLPPHYLCPNCKFADFSLDREQYGCGFDLPARDCPHCGTSLLKNGFDIPFEVFMGFKGNKAPDIDLNFSGVYQPVVHKYIEELFGEGYVFRAGTLSTIAEKSALGYAKKYMEDHETQAPLAELERLAMGVTDVKKSTGQHPGGMVVLPKAYDIHTFTPLQYPANDPRKGKITTHFAFSHLHDTMLKLDILGHDDPTAIRMLEDMTGISVYDIPLDDPKVMSLFLSTEALGVSPEDIDSKTGTYGIPEFGTNFVRKMLMETRPTCFADLVRISGLSHGTDVWTNNAQELIASGKAVLSDVICTREDIMNHLVYLGMEPIDAFTIMESVRKGKGLKDDMAEKMRAVGVPEWFEESCRKIKYMFPKAHAAAYVTMACRIAYFKIYYPKEYYCTYFTVRADDFDIKLIQGGIEGVRENLEQIKGKQLNAREKGIQSLLELALEMMARGIEFAEADIYTSEIERFTITEDGKIRPPLNALAGLGLAATQQLVAAREGGPYTSREELMSKTGIKRSVIDILDSYGILRDLPETNQLTFF